LRRISAYVWAVALSAVISCSGTDGRHELIVFHAGSLAVPMKRIAEAFEDEHPGVRVYLEAAGSRECARKIADLGRPCDVMASADYTVIDSLLIPEHADWNVKFAGNEMTIVYREESRGAGEIGIDNWYDVLLRDDVAFGRSDPDSDPCGYRTVLALKLAERHYGAENLCREMLEKDTAYIRPKETDLLALLESGTIDYIFLYRSVAEQHGLKYLVLPPEINLGNPAYADLYGSVSVQISGRRPGTTMTKSGAPMVYGVTIPKNAPQPALALEFVAFLLTGSKGLAILERSGQPPLVPSPSGTCERLPERLKQFALPADGAGGS
jgi:molybdate/tungstate transport system substrate-binding protein